MTRQKMKKMIPRGPSPTPSEALAGGSWLLKRRMELPFSCWLQGFILGLIKLKQPDIIRTHQWLWTILGHTGGTELWGGGDKLSAHCKEIKLSQSSWHRRPIRRRRAGQRSSTDEEPPFEFTHLHHPAEETSRFTTLRQSWRAFRLFFYTERSLRGEWLRHKCYFLNGRTVLMYVLFSRVAPLFCFLEFSVHISPVRLHRTTLSPPECLFLLYPLCCLVHESKHGNLIPPVRKTWGFVESTGMSKVWSCCYRLSQFFHVRENNWFKYMDICYRLSDIY